MTLMTRRRLLQLSGSGGAAALLASGRAPAFAQGTTLHWVRGSDYVPVSDQTLRTKILEQCQKDLGIKFNLETVDGLTIQARVTSAVSSGTGPDIISSINNWAQLYAESVAETLPRKSARRRAAITKPPRPSPMTAKSGLPSRTRLSACRSSTAPRGGTKSATGRKNIRKPGRNGARLVRS